jgi:hypothetical protein
MTDDETYRLACRMLETIQASSRLRAEAAAAEPAVAVAEDDNTPPPARTRPEKYAEIVEAQDEDFDPLYNPFASCPRRPRTPDRPRY